MMSLKSWTSHFIGLYYGHRSANISKAITLHSECVGVAQVSINRDLNPLARYSRYWLLSFMACEARLTMGMKRDIVKH